MHGRRNFSGLGGIPAHNDAKIALSSQLDNIKKWWRAEVLKRDSLIHIRDLATRRKIFSQIPKGTLSSGYAQLKAMQTEINKYNSWDSTWLPLALGGWYSSDKIKSEIALFDKNILAPSAITSDPAVVIAAGKDYKTIKEDPKDCKQLAISKYGPMVGRTPGLDTLACSENLETKVKIALVVGAIGITAWIFRPYMMGLNKVIS